jgi:hypothetical protein
MVLGVDHDGFGDRPLFGETRHRVSIMKNSVLIK